MKKTLLKEFLKIVSDEHDMVTVRIGKNMPLHLKFDLVDGKVNVEYFIAPRIDEYEFEKVEETEVESREEVKEKEEVGRKKKKTKPWGKR